LALVVFSTGMLHSRLWLPTLALVVLSACGTSPTAAGPAARIGVQSGDLPKALQRCAESGAVSSYLDAVKFKDPRSYRDTNKDWDRVKRIGAVAVELGFYTDTKSHCTAIESTSNPYVSSSSFPAVLNFVIQFKDVESAAAGFTDASFYGYFEQSTVALNAIGSPGATLGDQTGLGPNSAVLGGQDRSYFEAIWQRGAFLVILVGIHLDVSVTSKVALAENSRIPSSPTNLRPSSPTAAPQSPHPATTLYVLAPAAGSSVGGMVQVEAASDGVTLTADVNGLVPGRAYLVDADPLPCELFAFGPSQSFATNLTADGSGKGRVTWTVPTGMAGSASVRALTDSGTYAVGACADLSP
jgi:hypothetical protein